VSSVPGGVPATIMASVEQASICRSRAPEPGRDLLLTPAAGLLHDTTHGKHLVVPGSAGHSWPRRGHVGLISVVGSAIVACCSLGA
jgi:hypothetical protein